MGRNVRQKPVRLAEKLARIRTELGLSQADLIKRLNVEGIRQSHISAFEVGSREPSLIVLLQYARIARVAMEILVDDNLNLPKQIPALRDAVDKKTARKATARR